MVELWPLGHSWYGNPFLDFICIEKCWKRYLFNECKTFKGLLECTCFKHVHNAQSHHFHRFRLRKYLSSWWVKSTQSWKNWLWRQIGSPAHISEWNLWNHVLVVPTSSDFMEVMLTSLSLAPGHSARCDVGTHRSLVWLKCDAFQPKRRLTNHSSFWPLPLETKPCKKPIFESFPIIYSSSLHQWCKQIITTLCQKKLPLFSRFAFGRLGGFPNGFPCSSWKMERHSSGASRCIEASRLTSFLLGFW